MAFYPPYELLLEELMLDDELELLSDELLDELRLEDELDSDELLELLDDDELLELLDIPIM